MDEQYIRDRISSLRIQKGVSEYKMSINLGHSKGYIQGISSGRALPSMSEFLYICDYLGVTPLQFFDDAFESPTAVNELLKCIANLSPDDIEVLLAVAKRFNPVEK